MKTEMKKNNKMFLALAVIAALAMVSVAGVALNSEESEALIIEPNNFIVEAGETYPGDFSVTTGGKLSVLGTYSGTVKFYKNATIAVDEEPVTVIVFTGVTNAVIENTSGKVTIWTYNDPAAAAVDKQNVTGGTISVSKGTVTLGKDATDYFAGTVSGKTMTLASVNTFGAVIEAGSTDALSGLINLGSQHYTKADGTKDVSAAKLTVTGTGVYKYTEVGTVELVIAEGATLSNHVSAQTYDIDMTVAGTPTYGKLFNATAPYAEAYNGTLAVNKVTFTGVDVTKAYLVAIVNADSSVYFAKVTFTHTVDVWVPAYTAATLATTAGAATGALGIGTSTFTGVATDTDTFKYSNATDTILYISSFVEADTVTVSGDTVTLTGVRAANSEHRIAMLFVKTADGTPYFYNGSLKTAAATGDNSFVAGGANTAPSATSAIPYTPSTLKLGAASTLKVAGTLKASIASAAVFGTIDNSAAGGKIDVTGMIEYEHATGLVAAGLTATAYKVTADTKTTYYYTTFNKALAASADITVYGTKAFLEDQTWTTGKAEATATKITFAGAAGSATVGLIDEEDASKDVFVTITVPKTTTIEITTDGALKVVNGKIIFLEAEVGNNKIASPVGMKEGTSYVYTDLSTALSIAAADDTVTLRGPATIAKNTEITEGVTVTSASFDITVNPGATFTVSGTLTMTGTAKMTVMASTPEKTAGTLTVNKMFTMEETGTFTVDGIFNVTDKVGTSTAPVAMPANILTAGTEANPAIINIAGNVTNAKTIGAGNVMTINVTGKLANTVTLVFGAANKITMNVTGEFSYLLVDSILNLNVTGKGIVKDASVDGVIFTVIEKAVIGTPAKEIASVANGATAKFTLNTTAHAIVYGTPATGKVEIDPVEPVVTTTLYMKTFVYGKVYAKAALPVPLDTPEITGYDFMGYYDNPTFIGAVAFVNDLTPIATTTSYYMKLEVAMTSITVDTPVGAVVKINGATYDGNESVPYASTYTITVSALKGYNADNAKIFLNGEPVTGTVQLKAGDVITVEGIEESSEQGSNIVVYLLIAITVIIAVIAVVVAVKLLRS